MKRARRAAAATIAFYATVNTYEPLFAAFASEVQRIQQAAMRSDTPGMIAAVSDEMVEAFAVAGDIDSARKKLAAYGDLADQVILSPPDQLVDQAESERYRSALIDAFGV